MKEDEKRNEKKEKKSKRKNKTKEKTKHVEKEKGDAEGLFSHFRERVSSFSLES